ncbi:MAG TPA: hypothetical protein VFQ25_08495 [Ktedonobacterales bacterium]|nr:hypothetical protein [Ktedonobacterales bacterium]
MTVGGEALAQSVADTSAALSGQMLLKPFGIDALLMAVSAAVARRRAPGG